MKYKVRHKEVILLKNTCFLEGIQQDINNALCFMSKCPSQLSYYKGVGCRFSEIIPSENLIIFRKGLISRTLLNLSKCFYADELSGFCLRRTVDTDINKITENLYVWLGVETPIKSRSL